MCSRSWGRSWRRDRRGFDSAVLVLEQAREEGADVVTAARAGASGHMRAILMTAAAMIAGMIPLALGLGEADQTAPLGRA